MVAPNRGWRTAYAAAALYVLTVWAHRCNAPILAFRAPDLQYGDAVMAGPGAAVASLWSPGASAARTCVHVIRPRHTSTSLAACGCACKAITGVLPPADDRAGVSASRNCWRRVRGR